MSPVETVRVAGMDEQSRYIQWGPAIAGAIFAAALALVLHAFAAAVGLAVSSTAPTWRDSSVFLQIVSGLYLVLAALVSFGAGGYLAGRMRARLDATSPEETEFRDGSLGLVVWGIAMMLTALLAWGTAQSLTRLAAPSGGSAGTAQSVAGENIIAFDLDRLFRTDRRPANIDLAYARSEAARILLTSAGHSGINGDDRAYLIRLVVNSTALSPPDAEKRVDTIITQARDNIRKARRSGVILAFMAGAAALLGAAVAWFAAGAGGEHRDGRVVHPMTWGWPGRRTAVTR